MELVQDIWTSLRPYFVQMMTDALISAFLWIFLWLFKSLTSLLSIPGWAGEYITNIHSMGAVLAFAAFAILFLLDVVKLRQNR